MRQVVIENPILNSPFVEPARHFRFTDDGITDEIVASRRISSYFIPIARPRSRGRQDQMQAAFEDWTADRIEENKLVNRIRERVQLWRRGHYAGVSTTTRLLLDYWNNPEREKKLFFCQIEALETLIYITEVAGRYGDAWIENELRAANDSSDTGLARLACKMATGSGKTVVMGMVIAWHVLNKIADRQNARYSDTFLIVTPGITIRDRLRVLLPNDPDNYYRLRDLVPTHLFDQLGQAKTLITNFHAFKPRETIEAGKLTKSLLSGDGKKAFVETPNQMVRRVCRELGTKKNIIVLNDEAHHCYRHKPEEDGLKLKGDDRKEAEKREEEARIWISGLEAVKAKIGIKAVYDLSATPFFLRGSGYPEGTLFPWVVSDFSLIDAIESGIVKVPRVPVSDNALAGEQPTYRDLWLHIRNELPKHGRSTEEISGQPNLPLALEGALKSLYSNYEHYYQKWQANTEAQERGLTPPVFIVVCNNTNVSRLVYQYIAGWEKKIGEKTVVQAGALDTFRNDDGHGEWLPRPNTILIDSGQLESGEAMNADFKKIAALEIEEFKAEYRARFPGRETDQLTDEDLLREVMNTVGKPGKLGEHIKCVVSVSMLTEGWDANTVTHVLGVRAFGTQLLCEQVVGRALRRMSYAPNEQGMFNPEYAEVFGVPFSFIPATGTIVEIETGARPTRVRALEERLDCEITFPRVTGYRHEVRGAKLKADFTADSRLALSTQDIPTRVESAPIVGESTILTLDDLKARREPEVAFLLAKHLLEISFKDDDGNLKPWLFPQLLGIARKWMAECLDCKDNTFPQLLLLTVLANAAATRIYKAIVQAEDGEPALKPILRPFDTVGSTRFVDFDTVRPVYTTRADKCHVSHVVADTKSWEQKMAQTLEDMDEVLRYVKNHYVNFTIPYVLNGQPKQYHPDFIVHVNDGRGGEDYLNLILEVTGEKRADKMEKVATARNLWVPAVNAHGGYGRWAFIEIVDPWDAQRAIRSFLQQLHTNEKAA